MKNQKVTLFISTLNRKKTRFSFESSTTIKNIKEKIGGKPCRIFFGEKELEDDRTIEYYKIQNESTLLLMDWMLCEKEINALKEIKKSIDLGQEPDPNFVKQLPKGNSTETRFVYRAIHSNEVPELGLVAALPDRKMTLGGHVSSHHKGSQFISATKLLEFALYFGCYGGK